MEEKCEKVMGSVFPQCDWTDTNQRCTIGLGISHRANFVIDDRNFKIDRRSMHRLLSNLALFWQQSPAKFYYAMLHSIQYNQVTLQGNCVMLHRGRSRIWLIGGAQIFWSTLPKAGPGSSWVFHY